MSSCPPKKARTQGAGRKRKAPELRIGLFNWGIDVRKTLKGRLPRRIFKMKANQNPVPENERLTFSNQWVKEWEQEYGISLRKPNKKYSIKKEDLVECLQDYLKNVWRVRLFIEKYGVDLPVINGDQMPLHRNESSQQKTMTFKNENAFLKENHSLSSERITVFMQVSSTKDISLIPEFIFK